MIRHQDIGVHLTLAPLCELAQVMKKKLIIHLGKETRLAVVSPLDNMNGQARDLQSPASWHATSTAATHRGMTRLQRIA